MMVYITIVHSFSLLSSIPLYRYTTVYLSIAIVGCLRCFQFLTLTNKASMSILIHFSVWTCAFISLESRTKSEITGLQQRLQNHSPLPVCSMPENGGLMYFVQFCSFLSQEGTSGTHYSIMAISRSYDVLGLKWKEIVVQLCPKQGGRVERAGAVEPRRAILDPSLQVPGHLS